MKKYLFLLFLPLMAFAVVHKFYVSVTNITYSEKDDALQVTTRIFIDDLEEVFKARYDFEPRFCTAEESSMVDRYLEKYLRTKFLVLLDGQAAAYSYLGKKYDNDVVICYLEVPKAQLKKHKTMEVQNELLTDFFDDQKNIVHIKWLNKKKSFVLIKSNAKGMLNL